MKRMIKSSLIILLLVNIFIAWPEKMPLLKVAAAEETVDNDRVIEEVILKVEMYLSEYFKDFPAGDLESEKNDPKEYLTEKLQADDFTEKEIGEIFEIMAEKRQGELNELIEIYLEKEPYISKNALILILTESGYSQGEVEQVLESVSIDWKEQAVKASNEYINTEVEIEDDSYEIISRKYLFQFLMEEIDFTMEEAIYGIEESAIDWSEQAFKQAKYYLATDAYSKKSLIIKLITDGFTKEEAAYGVTETQTNWNDQAVKIAEAYLDYSLLQSKKEVVEYLEGEGFVANEIAYVVSLIFKDEEEELEIEEPSVMTPPSSVPEKPIVIRPIECITSHLVISAQATTNKVANQKEVPNKRSSSTPTQKSQSVNIEVPRVVETEVEEAVEGSLFDSPIFAPVILVLIVGNIYLFQKS